MSVKIEIQNLQTDLAIAFICRGGEKSVNGNEFDVLFGDIQNSQSPLARDLHWAFREDVTKPYAFNSPELKNQIMPVDLVRLKSMPDGTDVVGVQLKQGQQWTDNYRKQALVMFERRITPLTGAVLPTIKKDFRNVSDEDVKAVMKATLPTEVYKDNSDPENAVTIANIDRAKNTIDYVMSQACAEGACGPFAVKATQNRIEQAMERHFGARAIRMDI